MNNDEQQVPAVSSGFDVTPTETKGVAVATAEAREQHEIQSAIISAKNYPRDENGSYTKAMRSFQRESMADSALYNFPRGGRSIEGPSVQSARELARCWENLRSGIRIAAMTDTHVRVKGFCYDTEANLYVENEDEFAKKIQRKNKRTGVTEWIEPDERDLRELINKHGAICVRNAILQVLPPDLVDDAMKTAKATLRAAAGGKLKRSRDEVIKSLVTKFDELSVSTEMLEKRLGHKLKDISEDELVELGGIYRSIKDGNSQRAEHFSFGKDNPVTKGASEMEAALKKKAAKKSTNT